MSISVEVSRGAIIAREVWDFIQSQKSVKLVPWTTDSELSSYWGGYRAAFRQIEELIIEKSEKLKGEVNDDASK